MPFRDIAPHSNGASPLIEGRRLHPLARGAFVFVPTACSSFRTEFARVHTGSQHPVGGRLFSWSPEASVPTCELGPELI
jgi:hypothetical protein